MVEFVATGLKKTKGRISAKRLLPAARAFCHEGLDRDFRLSYLRWV